MISSDNNTLTNNLVENSRNGIYLLYASGNTLTGNTAINNNLHGIIISSSLNNLLMNNEMAGNDSNFNIYGDLDSHFNNNIDASNTVEGRPIYYLLNAANQVYDNQTNAGTFYCISCNNVTVRDLSLAENNNIGVFFWKTNNSRIENVVASNSQVGIIFNHSGSNHLSRNAVNSNDYGGIVLLSSSDNTLSGNTVNSNKTGGVGLSSSSNRNILTGNTISLNEGTGISLSVSDDNKIYHNNFIDNYSKPQAYVYEGIGNLFNSNYPEGGNYWSDYTGQDQYSGPNQNQPDPDKMGDTPYSFNYGGQDRYPFMEKDGWAEKTLSEKAAELAKELVNSAYLYGGKGWDYNQSEFVVPAIVKTGYNFWNNATGTSGAVDFGKGVDCSGLIMWAYDRSFDPSKSRFNNFVKAEGADEQFRENTTSTTEAELKPGDVMFFDNAPDGFIDHVAMYVGESGGFDAVSAVDRTQGIRGVSKDALKQSPGFVAFKQVVSASKPAILVSAYSPVDLTVTDPNGFTITPETIIPSDLEFLRQIPGVLYYSEIEKGADGNPIDQVYSYDSKTGDYIIKVLPEPGVSPTSTYSLTFQGGDQVVLLAQNALVSQAPSQGYGITVSATGTVSSFIPVAIDIKPGSFPNSINLKSKGTTPVAVLTDQSFNAKDIVVSSIIFAGAKPTKGKLEDIDKDGDLDLILHFDIQLLQLSPTSIKAVLTGQLANGNLIKGIDSVRVAQKVAEQTIFTKLLSYFNQFIQNLISAIGLAAITK